MSVTPPLYADESTAPKRRSRIMKISHNLRAALEYDEQTRGASDNTSAPSSRRPSLTADSSPGLPPPPRPKSQASLHKSKSPPMSPTAPLTGLQDTAQAASSSGPESITPTTANPYINPPPRLSHLLVENSTALAHNRSFSLPDSSPRSRENSPRTSESPRSDAPHASPVQVSSPESSGASAGPEVRSSFQRHLRYLSSLQRVEKILVKGKTRAVGKAADGRARDARDGRRGSVGGSPEACDRDTMGREGQAAAGRRRRIRAGGRAEASEAHALGASSAPTSPTGTMSHTAVERAEPSGGAAGRRRASRRSVGLLPDADPAAGIGRLPLRPLISHARRASQASTAAGSDESHDPPNTPREARISVSSTVYHDDRYSVHDFAPADAPLTPPYPPSAAATPTTATMPDSDRESFIDLASPTFSPRLTDFSSNSSFAAHGKDYHHPYATIPDNSDAPPASRAKPTLPSISTITTKPPVPTAPKPNFNRRSRSVQPPTTHHDEGPDSPSVQEITYTRGLPPTTNLLHPHERAEGVRKTRKIAQVFGHTPAAPEALSISQVSFEASVPNGLLCAPAGLGAKRSLKHHRGAVSMSVAPGGDAAPQPLWPPPEPDASRYAALSTRRHSTPLTPETFSFMDDDELSPSESRRTSESGSRHSSALIEVGSQQGTPYSEWSGHVGRGRASVGPTSPTSFMDLSEEELLADGVSSLISIETPKDDRRPGVLKSSSSSIYSFTSEDLAEEDRRRKREKLAKLHRFLGSRVPADLVLGQLSLDAVAQDLPPVVPISAVDPPSKHMDGEGRKNWVRRRRSSSVGELGGRWQDDLDRLKEELNNKEKALNVKRAVKMEKMFGVAPPQTLYHTRSNAPPTHSSSYSTSAATFPSAPSSPSSPSARNPNQSAYTRNKVKKGHNRPGTADSAEPLISSHGNGRLSSGFSEIYEHYRHSLNSLNDIIDRDDKESLQRLHGIIHGGPDPPLQEFARQGSPSPPPTPKAERRRSLPTRASITSLASAYSVSTVITTPPEESAFQARRRRAAKLTQFFGVDYRDLMNDVFESLEMGLEEERGRGTLQPDEVQELLHKLRKLKSKRNSLFD